MFTKKRILLIITAILIILPFLGYKYITNGAGRNIAAEKSAFIINATAITNEFVTDANTANKKYLEKAIEITGEVTAINDTIVTLNNNVICNFKTANKTITLNQNATIKGRVVGYDDLMGELQLDNCFSITN